MKKWRGIFSRKENGQKTVLDRYRLSRGRLPRAERKID
jgi:hypothetical protein